MVEEVVEMVANSVVKLAPRLDDMIRESISAAVAVTGVKSAESEIDLSKLHLNLNNINEASLEETASSERLKEVILDIEKDLEDNR